MTSPLKAIHKSTYLYVTRERHWNLLVPSHSAFSTILTFDSEEDKINANMLDLSLKALYVILQIKLKTYWDIQKTPAQHASHIAILSTF